MKTSIMTHADGSYDCGPGEGLDSLEQGLLLLDPLRHYFMRITDTYAL
jgi:hypothetical protein